jgi:hypothetical protein
MENNEFRVLLKKYSDRRLECERVLINGDAKDYTEYKYLCGIITGLNTAEREVLILQAAMEKRDGNA